MADIYSAALATVQFVCGPIWRYSKDQYQYKADLKAFNDRKDETLAELRETIQSRVNSERQTGRKIARPDVVTWLAAAGQEINKQSVEDEVSQSGCLLSCICRTRVLKRRTADLVQLLDQGRLLSQMPSLVHDDYSAILLDDIQRYKEQKEKLLNKFDDVQLRLPAQLQDGVKIVKKEVKWWLRNVEEKTSPAATSFENQFANGPYDGDFPRCFRERKQQLEELLHEGTLLPESLVVDDPSASAPPMLTSELRGSDAVKAEIWGHLMGDETSKIGVWGMGGVGKTTIMKHVYNQLLNESIFKKVIWVTVSQAFDVRRIQQEIASGLGENLSEHQSTDVRAATLSKMLETRKPCVVILDDVWERFELHEVGLPEIFDNCSKLVLTTRSEQVARVMDCERVKVNTLPWEESLKLFKDTAGVEALSDDGGAEGTLEEMVHECGGLPLAIKTVAASMKGISDPCMWRAALNQLKEGKRNVAGRENDQFRVLKFSYDWLSDEKIKHCFLHCAMYPEDKMIPKEELIELWMDEELIDVVGTRQGMKDQGHANLNKLIENCLLESVDRRCVRMHDLVRDMAIDITRSSPRFLVKAGVGLRELPEEREWEENLSKVSLMFNNIEDIPPSMPSPKCPILTTLLLSKNYNLSTIPENFFEHMPELKVLDLSENSKLRSLPSSVSKLVKLTTLLLRYCRSLKEVPSLSNLTALKKLDLYKAGVEEVPHGLEMLLNLKYLDIRRWRGDRVPTGWIRLVSEILPNLSKLQHLGLHHRLPVEGGQLPVEGGQLGEIWPKLESFYGSFRTWSDMSIVLNKRQKRLYHYNIYVGGPDEMDLDSIDMLNCIICFDVKICGEPGSIPSDVQMLAIGRCNDVRSLNAISGFQDVFDLKMCGIRGCREVEYVFSGLNQLSKLKRLELYGLKKLKGLFDSEAAPPPLAVFSSLEEISIRRCPKIKKLFPTTLQCLANLKEVSVYSCSQLEEILVAPSSEGAPPLVNFSSLEEIYIRRCPKIKKLFPTTWQYLPNLKEITVCNCSQLEEIMVASSEEGRVIHAKLEKLTLKDLPMLKSISSLTDASAFDSLKELRISGCPNLEHVLRGQFKFNSLQTLETLWLVGLLSLKSIFHEEADESLTPLSGTEAVSFRLKEIRVVDCPQLKNIFTHAGQLDSFKNLEWIEVKGCDLLEEIMSASSETEEDQSEPIFPKLKYLSLIELPVLRRICSTLLVPDSLEELIIEDCPNLSWESLFGLHAELPQKLLYLWLKGVRKLESVFDEEASDSLAALWRLPPAATSTFYLQDFRVANCPQLKKIFTHAGLLGYLQNIMDIKVTGCDELEEIISSRSDEEPPKLTHLPMLERLHLDNLPKLKRVCTGTSALVCDDLENLTISGCTDLKRFPLHLHQSDNGELSPPPELLKIELSGNEIEWWESLEWDQPNAKDVLARFCEFT